MQLWDEWRREERERERSRRDIEYMTGTAVVRLTVHGEGAGIVEW